MDVILDRLKIAYINGPNRLFTRKCIYYVHVHIGNHDIKAEHTSKYRYWTFELKSFKGVPNEVTLVRLFSAKAKRLVFCDLSIHLSRRPYTTHSSSAAITTLAFIITWRVIQHVFAEPHKKKPWLSWVTLLEYGRKYYLLGYLIRLPILTERRYLSNNCIGCNATIFFELWSDKFLVEQLCDCTLSPFCCPAHLFIRTFHQISRHGQKKIKKAFKGKVEKEQRRIF